MIRQIIVPKEKKFQLEIPESFIGKKIEVIASEIEGVETNRMEKKKAISELIKKFEGFSFDGKGKFVFSREEATDYE